MSSSQIFAMQQPIQLQKIVAGTVVFNINDASSNTDVDADQQALSYEIIGGNGDGLFAINKANGEISQADNKSPNFEANGETGAPINSLTSDGEKQDDAVITVRVGIVNEIAPVIANKEVQVEENARTIYDFNDTSGNDQDAEKSSIAVFHYPRNNGNLFAIDAVTGEVTVANNKTLNFNTPLHTLTIRVDGSRVTRWTQC